VGGVPFGSGIRWLLDAHQRFFRAGLPAYLRTKNVDDSQQEYVKLGFQWTPTGNQATGFTDIRILPPPQVDEVSLHNIGLNQARLQFGARTFRISHTFVKARMIELNYTDPYKVFRDRAVVGLFYNGRLFSIESITHEEVAGETVLWNIVANATEQEVVVT